MTFCKLFNSVGIVVALAVAGCATRPTQDQLASADYGAYPDNYQQIVQDFFQKTLKDPASLQLQPLPTPSRGYFTAFGHITYGYRLCATYNAKNSYGGYVGYATDYLLIHDGEVVRSFSEADQKGMGISLC